MNSELTNAISNLVISARHAGITGIQLTNDESRELNEKLNGILPGWFEKS